jgi:tRNASer (uridine44-2'-O)-methyltransferase
MLNLVKNPNITSSHLFRADIFYDSHSDHNEALLKQLQRAYRPINANLSGFDIQRTIVRQLIPRNPQLDRPLVQTCHFVSKRDKNDDHMLVLYIPHAQRAEDIPFYHPAVAQIAFEHRSHDSATCPSGAGSNTYSISISYSLFPSSSLTNKLERTALRLLETVHKHGQGQLAGYQKRVHHDRIMPQKRYQDTYTRLKTKYGKQLSEQWVEVTDPGKHVFEDLSIAAFLIELWQEMYSFPKAVDCNPRTQDGGDVNAAKPEFPGFVDIGCGNGVLVYVLLAEGYDGWGFDARERKTWSIFPESTRAKLQRRLLIPEVLSPHQEVDEIWHNGVFQFGTFIISNHADELTTWTPLLAYLNDSAFIAIPCCSHDLAGARYRAPPTTKSTKGGSARLPQQEDVNGSNSTSGLQRPQAAETGSLKRVGAQRKMPSAYSTLCSYVTSLAIEVGFEPEHEVLRIPSTRNQAVIGRHKRKDLHETGQLGADARRQTVADIVEREMGRSIDAIGADWAARAEKLAKKPGSGH